MSKIVIVTGSRAWKDGAAIYHALDAHGPEIVVHGGALGADSIAHSWCKKRGRQSYVYFPDYERLGKGAPLVRNVAMLEAWPGAVVLGFPMPNSRGTYYTMREAEKRGMGVHDFGEDQA